MSGKQLTLDDITDHKKNIMNFVKEQYLGKGAFGRCYALRCNVTGKMYAGKFINKNLIEKYNITEKIIQEVNIHRSLNHENIVGFQTYIEDKDFIYMILELCSNQSMSELLQRRKSLLTFETKYFMRQIVAAVSYLHAKNIIHRDLKLANFFINSNMTIKVGDFGLAIKVTDANPTRHSLCGTPNYISPEVLSRKQHSFKADIWALGCTVYILLTGTAPFETNSVKETYKLILQCKYSIPESIKSSTALSFINCTLKIDPKERPSIDELSNHSFLNIGFIPENLPSSSIMMPPQIKTLIQYNRQKKHSSCISSSDNNKVTDLELLDILRNLNNKIIDIVSYSIHNYYEDDSQNPLLRPIKWINSWMDYSLKYGFGYRLNDNSVGTLFNDNTTLLASPNGKCVYYFRNDTTEILTSFEDIKTADLNKKVTLLKSFRKFMFGSLKIAYEDSADFNDIECSSSFPILKCWVNVGDVVGMYLSNGALQMNFMYDHTKLILCHEMDSITVITNGNQLRTFELSLVKTYGCDKIILDKLNETVNIIGHIIDKFSKTWINEQMST